MKRPPRNLSEVTSAFEVNFDNAPQSIYEKPKRYIMHEENKILHEEYNKTTMRKILDGIQQETWGDGVPNASLKTS